MIEKYLFYDTEQMIADYDDNCETLQSLTEQYAELCEKDIGSIDYSKDRVQTSPTNDSMINDLIRKTTLERDMKTYENDLARYDMAWERLTEKEQYILKEFSLYQRREKQKAIDNICDKYNVEVSWVYEMRKNALKRFKMLMFG